jgi:hypothetical protein
VTVVEELEAVFDPVAGTVLVPVLLPVFCGVLLLLLLLDPDGDDPGLGSPQF